MSSLTSTNLMLVALRLTLSQPQNLSHSLALSLLQCPTKELPSIMEPSSFLLQWWHNMPWSMARRKISSQSSLDASKTNLQHCITWWEQCQYSWMVEGEPWSPMSISFAVSASLLWSKMKANTLFYLPLHKITLQCKGCPYHVNGSFSSMGLIDDKHRGSLPPSTFEALQVMKMYYKSECAWVELEEKMRWDAQKQQWEKDCQEIVEHSNY